MDSNQRINSIEADAQRAIGLARSIGVSEDEFYDLLDGSASSNQSRARLAELQARLDGRPELARLVRSLGAQRAGLESLGREISPTPTTARVLAGVEERLSRAAIEELIEAEHAAAPASIPISSVTRPSVFEEILSSLRESAAVRRLALAACAVLALGGMTWLAQSVFRAFPSSARFASTSSDADGGSESSRLAINDDAMDAPGMESGSGAIVESEGDAALAMDRSSSSTDQATADVLLAAAEGEDASDEITLHRAAELAREGRLVIVVRTLNAPGLSKRLALVSSPTKLSAESPVATLTGLHEVNMSSIPGAMASLTNPSSGALRSAWRPGAPDPNDQSDVASGSGAGGSNLRVSQPDRGGSAFPDLRVQVAGMYVSRTMGEQADLARVVHTLRAALKGAQMNAPGEVMGFVSGVAFAEAAEASVNLPEPTAPTYVVKTLSAWPGAEKFAYRLRNVPIIVESVEFE